MTALQILAWALCAAIGYEAINALMLSGAVERTEPKADEHENGIEGRR